MQCNAFAGSSLTSRSEKEVTVLIGTSFHGSGYWFTVVAVIYFSSIVEYRRYDTNSLFHYILTYIPLLAYFLLSLNAIQVYVHFLAYRILCYSYTSLSHLILASLS